MLSFLSWPTCKIPVLFLCIKRFIDRSAGAYFFGPVHTCTYIFIHQLVVSIIQSGNAKIDMNYQIINIDYRTKEGNEMSKFI